MDTSLLSQLKEVGIAIASVAGFAYITKMVIDGNKKVFDQVIEQLDENRKDYAHFVNDNNHKVTERLEEVTLILRDVSHQLQALINKKK